MSYLALQDLLAALSSDTPLKQIMTLLCSEIEQVYPDISVFILRLDDNDRLQPLAAPGLPEDFIARFEGLPAGPASRTSGIAVTYGRPFLTYDIQQDPHWSDMHDRTKSLGLYTCWSHPVTGRDARILGCIAFYFRQPTYPTEIHTRLLQDCLSLCTLAFEHEASQQKIKKLAYFDPLTGLPNRVMLRKEVERAIARDNRDDEGFSLLFIDLDNFKKVNDLYGHSAGDEVLHHIGAKLQSCVRQDGCIGRLSGDEFLAIVRHGSRKQAYITAERILETVNKALLDMNVKLHQVRITLSIGIAMYPRDGTTFDAIVDHADSAMYEAKKAGKNRIKFYCGQQYPSSYYAASGAGTKQTYPDDMSPLVNTATSLYGPDLKQYMDGFQADIRTHLHVIIKHIFDWLSRSPHSGHIINSLSPEEVEGEKRHAAASLILLSSSELTQEEHNRNAISRGHLYAKVGLSRKVPGGGYDHLLDILRHCLDEEKHARAFSVFGQRLLRDLSWMISATQHVQSVRNRLLLKISQLAWTATNYMELIARSAGILCSHDEIAACLFISRNGAGVLESEVIAGQGAAELVRLTESQRAAGLSGAGDTELSPGPSIWAWRSGQTERCFNYATDPRVQSWQPFMSQVGYRSSICLPLVMPGHTTPTTLLSVYSRLPGGYASLDQDAFFTQIRETLVFGLVRLNAFRDTFDTVHHETRMHWLSLLHNGGLEMFYQPAITLKNGRIAQVEALARIRDGAKILTPDKFLPILSPDDLFTLYVKGLNQVLAQRAVWEKNDFTPAVSVNLPASALGDPRYLSATLQALQQHQCPPGRLTLEILESEKISSDGGVLASLEAYKRIGVCLAEDDLGAGYSTLGRLREMPFDTIKIDRSIVRQADSDPYNTLRFIYQLTRLGHGMGKKVTVEGVESTALLQAIKILGADCVQGYIIAKPMPVTELNHWILHHSDFPEREDIVPEHMFTRLARILLWEESLHILQEIPHIRASKTVIMKDLFSCMREQLEAGSDDAGMKSEMVECAITCGLQSQEYINARTGYITHLIKTAQAG